MKSSSTVGYGATNALSLTNTFYQDVFADDPHTSTTWANAAIDSMEIGLEVA